MNPFDDTESGLNTTFNWNKIDELPNYHIESDTRGFIRLVAFAKQRPIGVLPAGGDWCVLFKYNRTIKYIHKYMEEYLFNEQEWSELRKSLNKQECVYLDLLEEMERNKNEYDS